MILHILSVLLKLYTSTIFLFPLLSVHQEYKIWNHAPHLPPLTLWGMWKVYWFNVCWVLLTQIGVIVLLPKRLVLGGKSVEKDATCWVERWTAFCIVKWFIGPVVLKGTEHLPPPNDDMNTETTKLEPPYTNSKGACVFIANHSSQIDAGVVYYIHRRFKWIAKRSIIYMPGVGQIMAMAKHIFINRQRGSNKSNIAQMYADAHEFVKEKGGCMFVFPQGTRRMVERLPFKDGAFKIVVKAHVPLVPISIEIPHTAWNGGYPLNVLLGKKKLKEVEPVVLTVHPPVEVKEGAEKEELKKTCLDIIYSVLPEVKKGDSGSSKDGKKND